MVTILKEMQLSLKEDKGFNNCQAIARSLLSMGYSDNIVMSHQICEDITIYPDLTNYLVFASN